MASGQEQSHAHGGSSLTASVGTGTPGQRPPARSGTRLTSGVWGVLVAASLVVSGCTSSEDGDGAVAPDVETTDFVHAAGPALEVGGERIRLKAMNFSNFYYEDLGGTRLLESTHHSERDFERVKELGFNSIRFAFDGDWFYEDRDAFWQWMDRNVAWAKEHKLRLILDLHRPVSSDSLPEDGAEDADVWSDAELQDRNATLWREIARRYRDEPAVAAYDLFNEPVTQDSTGEQWEFFAQRLVDAVRSVDRNHLIVVGELLGVQGRMGTAPSDPSFLVDDDNVMYDFHFYEPFDYTHQYASWHENPTDGGQYPDPDMLRVVGDPVALPESRISTDSLPLGDSGWEVYDSGKVTIEDSSAMAAIPRLLARNGMEGTAHFDNVTVTEYAPDGTELRQVIDDELQDEDGETDWYPWQRRFRSTFGYQTTGEDQWHRQEGELGLTDATNEDLDSGWANDDHLFQVIPGNQYRVQGSMRGEDIAASDDEDPQIRLELDVYAEPSDEEEQAFLARDKTYLEHELTEHLRLRAEHDVPMSVMEFGTMRETFEMPGKGGDQWVTDVLDLLDEHNLSFAYWEYNGRDFGLYTPTDRQPGTPNEELQEVLRREL